MALLDNKHVPRALTCHDTVPKLQETALLALLDTHVRAMVL